jgi:hypothetical protein
MAAMTLARVALLVAVYVSLDVSNPSMPGALTFGVEQSVEGRQSDRFRGQDHHAAPVPRAPEPERRDPSDQTLTLRRLPAPVAPRARQARVTRSRLSMPVSNASSEDN